MFDYSDTVDCFVEGAFKMYEWQHIEFLDGNPYICKTEKEFKRIKRKYNLVKICEGFWREVKEGERNHD